MDDSYDAPPARGRLRLLPILIGVVLIGFTALRGCQQGPFGRHQIVGMGPEQEAALGAQAYSQVLTQAHVLRNEPVVKVIDRLAKDLIAASRDPGFIEHSGLKPPDFEWECNVVESDEVNAFCLPGGKIVVYTGILPVAQTESALAAVMGHEIGHALAHHGAERMAQQQMVQIAESSAAGALADMDPQKQREVLGVLGAGGKLGVLLPFSRKHESEADRIGLLLMAVAGRDPHYAVDFWQRMAKANRGGGRPLEFMSTHPSDARRVQDLEALLAEAMPFYERAPQLVADRPLPLDGVVERLPQRRNDRASSAPNGESTSKRPQSAIPRRVSGLLNFIDQHDRAPEGYEGGRNFLNLARDGEQALPRADASGTAVQYREWDVNPRVPGRNRGGERLITGSDGSAFYTSDHYRTFVRIR